MRRDLIDETSTTREFSFRGECRPAERSPFQIDADAARAVSEASAAGTESERERAQGAEPESAAGGAPPRRARHPKRRRTGVVFLSTGILALAVGLFLLLPLGSAPDGDLPDSADQPGQTVLEDPSGASGQVKPDGTETGPSGAQGVLRPEEPSPAQTVLPDYGVDPGKPMLALTFDDGPSQHTWDIVDALDAHGARATFFVLGQRVPTHQAAIDYVLSHDNEVASHSYDHKNMEKMTEEDMAYEVYSVDEALSEQHGYTPALFRVPYGSKDETVRGVLKEAGKPIIGWSVDPRDWKVRDKDTIVRHILSTAQDGDIVLLHDIYQPTADAVAELVPALQAQGFQLVTVRELFAYRGISLEPGEVYYEAPPADSAGDA